MVMKLIVKTRGDENFMLMYRSKTVVSQLVNKKTAVKLKYTYEEKI
jgi:hypothetical protein